MAGKPRGSFLRVAVGGATSGPEGRGRVKLMARGGNFEVPVDGINAAPAISPFME